MKYRYQCSSDSCSALNERIQSIHAPIPDSIDCEFCGAVAEKVVEAPAVMTASMTNQPFDVAVGRDAAARWADIHARQERRDKVRRETQSVGLSATSYDEVAPITPEKKQLRTRVMKAVERDGFKAPEIPKRAS